MVDLAVRGDTSDLRPDELIVAVCAFRLENVRKNLAHNMRHLAGSTYYVLLDRPVGALAQEVAQEVRAAGGTMRIVGATRGLSASRNEVLKTWPGRHVLFVDDDVRLDSTTVSALREGLRQGAHVVGARLTRPPELMTLPWYLTSGQFHLVGWHRDSGGIKIWGACMGVDVAFAQAHGLDFDPALSRTGGNLRSGEDTTFVSSVVAAGGHVELFPNVSVVHDVDLGRFDARYLLRRAYWQGRSEVGRNQPLAGLRKEIGRHRLAPESPWAVLLTGFYGAATLFGVVHELVLSRLGRYRGRSR